jgi:hypothetical protein
MMWLSTLQLSTSLINFDYYMYWKLLHPVIFLIIQIYKFQKTHEFYSLLEEGGSTFTYFMFDVAGDDVGVANMFSRHACISN